MGTISTKYAEFAVNTRYTSLGPRVVGQAKKLVLDLIGVSLAGYQMMAFPRMLVDHMISLGGVPEATIITSKKKFPAINAAMANAACAHAIDMDDGHRFGALHPGAVVIPAAMAAAELAQKSTKDMITGIVVGYEVMIRVGVAVAPHGLNRGFHITGIAGPFGAAAAAANILGFSEEETAGALGMAGLQASGLIQVNHEVEGAKVKPINPARAAVSGLLSCLWARKGFLGPSGIFEGEDGYLKAYSEGAKPDALVRGLGQEFEILNVYLKLYAACRHAHAPMDAALMILQREKIPLSQIREIIVETYPAAVRLAGIQPATTPSAGRFSIPFSVALVMKEKSAGADKYSDRTIGDEAIQGLAQKVNLLGSAKWEKVYPGKRGATVTIVDAKGRKFAAELDLAKGEPENPASWDEVYEKFRSNAGLLLSPVEVESLGNAISDLENSSVEAIPGMI